ncbi:MAG: hypothetical protein K6T16_01420 [Candidatus Pacearchaeota archaeon]|nr:hypothetical protein [Candidatus Pacearchaeota archaeon]
MTGHSKSYNENRGFMGVFPGESQEDKRGIENLENYLTNGLSESEEKYLKIRKINQDKKVK